MVDKQQEWSVLIENGASTVFGGSDLTKEDKEVIQIWAQFVKKNGPLNYKLGPVCGWTTHFTEIEKGERASSFSNRGRIVYKIDEENRTVIVTKITHEHDYKKGRF